MDFFWGVGVGLFFLFFETYFFSQQQDVGNFFMVISEHYSLISFIWITDFNFLAWSLFSTGHISQEIMSICLNTQHL